MICHLLMKTLAPDAVNSDVDALTGLLNRRGLEVRAKELAGDHTHRRVDVMMAVIDLDRFKLINDTHGHEAGDRVLIAVAATLTGASGNSALVARIGGEEFVVVELGGPTDAQRFGDALTESSRSEPCGVTARVGVAIGPPAFTRQSRTG
ncbi:GGDEF domain-containing protein [Gordonia sp. ABSL49_1]|uniref:GGDEF domain-containing protein n=1 Tax=Gordonia sp. ABSL49_1 TaxID=2920941 RepID=UPI001F0D3425|nr:GGDEF domain-containing protein [Gordonia sp. ABSL49_1]MCH5642896.1 GGDEF domain-containing protein [Gordonia sp. ABSL49_1]